MSIENFAASLDLIERLDSVFFERSLQGLIAPEEALEMLSVAFSEDEINQINAIDKDLLASSCLVFEGVRAFCGALVGNNEEWLKIFDRININPVE